MTTVVVDIGNARVKWARAERGKILSPGHALHGGATAAAIDSLAAALPEHVERVVVANVAGEALAAALAAFTARRFGVEPELVETAAETLGVRCGYRDPSRLGVDRWVAVIAAHRSAARHRGKATPACVINAGTALTFDAVDGGGQHLGGLILAGPRIAAAALACSTQRIGETSLAAERPEGLGVLGRSTDEAVGHAAWLAPAAAFDRVVGIVAHELGERPAVFLAGGDAPLLAPWLETAAQLKADFVLEGLALIAAETPPGGRGAVHSTR